MNNYIKTVKKGGMESKEMAKKLNQLLEKNFDAEKGFREAAEDVEEVRLQNFLVDKARQCYEFKHELESEIRDFGESPEKGSSFEGDMQRSWMNLKEAFSSKNEATLLQETAKGEKRAIEEYEKIIREDEFPPSTLNMLLRQKKEMERSLEEIEELEEEFH